MNRCGDALPACNLFRRVNARDACIAQSIRRRRRSFRDDQSCGSVLRVIFHHKIVWNVAYRAAARQGCHYKTILKCERPSVYLKIAMTWLFLQDNDPIEQFKVIRHHLRRVSSGGLQPTEGLLVVRKGKVLDFRRGKVLASASATRAAGLSVTNATRSIFWWWLRTKRICAVRPAKFSHPGNASA